MDIFDIAIVGAGVAGACVARECARFDARVVVLEAGLDVACGATRANSGIVHAGFDPEPGTAKARYNVEGAKLYPIWAYELGFPYKQNGSLVLAFTDDEMDAVRELAVRGARNGVDGLRVVDACELRAMEPHVSPEAKGALFAPTGGICDPYKVAFRAAENAAENGVEFRFDARVKGVERSSESGLPGYRLVLHDDSAVFARAVVNAAGTHADELAACVCGARFSIVSRRGEYRLMNTAAGAMFSHTVFQAPTKAGKGVLVTPTVHGNLLVGPNAVEQDGKDDVATTRAGLDFVMAAARKTFPELDSRAQIANFAGVRAGSSTGDFVIGEAPDAPGFFNVACFESPGLTSAPAVAADLAPRIAAFVGAGADPGFNPVVRLAPLFFSLDAAARAKAVAADPRAGRIVCRCKKVSEADVVAALHTALPVLCLDALKWRTEAMMGGCNGGFCVPEIVRIAACELGVSPDELPKRLAEGMVAASSPANYPERARAERALCDAPCAAEALRATRPCETADVRNAPGASVAACAREPSGADANDASDASGVRNASGAYDMPVARNAFGALSAASYDVVVIGGGAAGIAAACAAAREGARTLVLDREPDQGGILKQCIHNGFGLHRFGEELTGPEYASRELASLRGLAVDVVAEASVLDFGRKGDSAEAFVRVSYVAPGGACQVEAKSVVLATGSRERGVGALDMAGTRPAGVFSAGSAQNLMNLQGCLPGREVVVLGSGDIGLIMARRITLAGAHVVGVFEINQEPSGLRRNIVQCLDDFGIPLHTGQTVTRIEGEARVEAVEVSRVDPATFKAISGTQRRVACDTLLLSVGLVPENAMALAAGVELDPATGGAIVDDNLQTSVAGVFACGNALHIHDLVDFASSEGERAGVAAAQHAQRRGAGVRGGIPVAPDEGVRYVVPHFVHAESKRATLRFRTSRSFKEATVVVAARDASGEWSVVKKRRVMAAVPAEMQSIEVAGAQLAGACAVSVRVQEQR